MNFRLQTLDNSVSVTKLRERLPRNRGSVPGKIKKIFFASQRLDRHWCRLNIPWGVNPSSAEVKNDGAIPPVPHTFRWRDAKLIKHMDNFNFIVNLMVTVFNMEFYHHNDKLK
jgi:hypothetical protein